MLHPANLSAVLASLEALGGAQAGEDNLVGRWRQIALAAEAMRGSASTANDNLNGYMLRAAVALEAIAGTSGTEENATRYGMLKRLVDALEFMSGAVGSGSLTDRLLVAAGTAQIVSLDLAFKTSAYRARGTISSTLAGLPGYAQSAVPTINGTGYAHASGDNTRLTGLTNPTGDFTLVVDALGPASGAVVRIAAVLDGGGDNPTDRIEFWRNNSGDNHRIVVYDAGVTVLDTVTGTGTPAVGPVWAAGVTARLGIVRTAGVLRPYVNNTLQTGTPTYNKSLTALRLGHRWFGAAQVAPFESTIQRVRFMPEALSGAEIAALAL